MYRPTAGRVFRLLLFALVIGLAVVLAHRGWSFYELSLEDRVVHPDFRALRPSGHVGLGYGFVAFALVVLNLSYLIRRRLGSARLGSMKVWLDLHVFTGLTAAVLVAYHSAFQLRTPIAKTSAYSLLVVVATGLIGRFLFTLQPSAGPERLLAALDRAEGAFPGKRHPMVIALDDLPAPRVAPDAWLGKCLVAMVRWRRVARTRRGTLSLLVPPRREQDRAQRAAMAELYAASDAEARASGVTALLRSWRGLHRFFALLMLIAVGLHAGVAWHYGYRWIFS